MAAKQDAIKVLAERQLGDRFNAMSNQLEKAATSIDQLTAKNIELSRDMTAAESRVRELEKAIQAVDADRQGKGSEVDNLREQLAEAEEKNSILEKNLESVLNSKDQALKDATSELRQVKKEAKDAAKKLDQLEKQTLEERIEAVANRPMPQQLVIEKDLQGGFLANIVYDDAEVDSV